MEVPTLRHLDRRHTSGESNFLAARSCININFGASVHPGPTMSIGVRRDRIPGTVSNMNGFIPRSSNWAITMVPLKEN